MYIFHGDNHIASRQALVDFIEESRNKYVRTISYQASELSLAQLESALGEISLFNDQVLTVIEEVHSLIKSTHRTTLIDYLSKSQDIESIVLWEKKPLTPSQLALFNRAKLTLCKASKSLFRWLDSLSPNSSAQQKLQLFTQAVTEDGIEYCFLMLVRQIRLLLTVRDGGTIVGPPFVQRNLQNQARLFSLAQLLNIHEKLTNIDTETKTGGTRMTLKQQLDLLQIQL